MIMMNKIDNEDSDNDNEDDNDSDDSNDNDTITYPNILPLISVPAFLTVCSLGQYVTSVDICSFPMLLTPRHVLLPPPGSDEILVLVSHWTGL